MGATAPLVSVIVPVYNDGRPLASCLAALEAQTYSRDGYEVIVVDNGSDEPIDPVVGRHPQARLVVEPIPGSYAARNRGLADARGEIIAFTDADCVPAPDWIAAGVRRLQEHPECGAVAGRLRLTFRNPARPTGIDLYSSLTSKRQHVNVEWGFGETANLFTWRGVFERVGSFDPRLRARGDVIWGRRLGAAGYRLVYAEEVAADHPAPSFARFCHRVRRMAGGRFDVRRDPESARFDIDADGATDPGQIRRIMARTGHLGRWERLRVLAVTLLVQMLVTAELARLQVGGHSLR